LEQAFSADGSADHLAWRVYLRMMMGVERNPAQSVGIETEVDWLIGEALSLEPSNSLVLAAAAQAHMKVKNNVLSGYEYARRSVAVNPHNPMALDALVAANIFLERFDEAHRIATKARHITTNSPYRHWWEMGCCLTATVTGRLDEALIHAETSHQLAPGFKPPLRYLLALYSRLGDTDRAVAVLEKLRAIEPDFTIERMVQDPKYPVAALQRSKLLTPENFTIFGL
jgi:tetratricopeptide (TPR) repeat protein